MATRRISATTRNRWRAPHARRGTGCSRTPSTGSYRYTPRREDHIGEVHIAIEESLGDGQLSILIGRTDMWHMGYGRAGVQATLNMAFNELGLYRIWVDIPEYNEAARALFTHLGFTHEGTLRKSRPHEGSRHDSVVMGMLSTEYAQRSG